MALPFAIKDLPYWDSGTKKPLIAWSQSGIIASAIDRYITFYIEHHGIVDIYSSFKGSDAPITTLTWSQGFNSDGFTPLFLFYGDSNGDIKLFDFSRNLVMNTVHLKESLPISCVGSPVNPKKFYIGTSKNTIYCVDFSPVDTPNVVWTLQTPYTPNILRISPHNYTKLLYFCQSGEFSLITDINIQGSAKIQNNLVFYDKDHGQFMNCNFYPHLDNAIYIVASSGVFLYTFADNVFTLIYKAESRGDIIYDAFFPKSDDRLIAIIHRTNIRLSCIDMLSLDSFQCVNAINDGIKETYESGVGFLNDKLCLLSRGCMHMVQIVNRKFRVNSISRFPYSRPTDIAITENSIAISNEHGYVGMCTIPKDSPKNFVGSCSYNHYFKAIKGPINSISHVSDDILVISGTENNRQKVLLYNTKNYTFKSVLKDSQELASHDPPVITVSPNKQFFSVALGESILVLFNREGKQIASFANSCKTYIVFNTNPDEMWALTPAGTVYQFNISEQVTFVKNFQINIEKSLISSVIATNNCFFVGTFHGKVFSFGWDSKPISNVQVSSKPIEKIEFCKLNAIVIDSDYKTFFLDITHLLISKPMKQKAFLIKFISEQNVIGCLQGEKSISIMKTDLETRFDRVPTAMLDIPILFSDYSRKEYFNEEFKKVKTIQEAAKLCDLTGHFIFGEFLRAFSGVFSPLCYDISNTQENLQSLFKSLSYLFIRSHGDNATNRRVRFALLRGDRQAALEILLTPNASLTSFEKNALKAGYLNLESSAESAAVVAALVGNNCFDTAVDILLITKQYGQAARLCLQNSEYELALHIACSLARDEDRKETIEKIAKSLAEQRSLVHSAMLHLITGNKDKAKEILAPILDISSIISLFK